MEFLAVRACKWPKNRPRQPTNIWAILVAAFTVRNVSEKIMASENGEKSTLAEAIAERQAGRDVVVCGEEGRMNGLLAQRIESDATNRCHKFNAAHVQRGSRALPHYQHCTGKIAGHTFYESLPSARVVKRGARR